MKQLIAIIAILIMATGMVSATTYYVSDSGDDDLAGTSTDTAWVTIAKLNADGNHTSGDTVLFKRGDAWNCYDDEILKAKDGIIYGAYGTGNKPVLMNGYAIVADSNWTEDTAHALWNTTDTITYEVANLWNSSGSVSRNKTNSNVTLANQGDWMYEVATQVVMINSTDNPHTVYGDLILSVDNMVINITNADNVIISNLSLLYANDGVWGLSANNVTIVDCEIAYMGGAYQSGTTRYGNGITFWLSSNNTIVKNNVIHDVYDAAITHQANLHTSTIENAIVQNNIMYQCDEGYEYWNYANESGINKNILVDQNTVFNIGTPTWGSSQRAGGVIGRAVRISSMNNTLNGTFTNNLFINGSGVPFRWESAAKNWADNITTNWNNFYYFTGGSNGTYYPNNTIYRFNNKTQYVANRGQGQDDLFNYDPLFTDYVSFVPRSYSTCFGSSSGSHIGAVACSCILLTANDNVTNSIPSFCTNTGYTYITAPSVSSIRATFTSPTHITSSGATINASNYYVITTGTSSSTTYPAGTVWYNPARNTTVTTTLALSADSLSITDNEIEILNVAYESNGYRFTFDNVTFRALNSSTTYPTTLNQCTSNETALLYVVVIVFIIGIIFFAFELFSGNFSMYLFVGLLVALVLVGVLRTALFGGCI